MKRSLPPESTALRLAKTAGPKPKSYEMTIIPHLTALAMLA